MAGPRLVVALLIAAAGLVVSMVTPPLSGGTLVGGGLIVVAGVLAWFELFGAGKGESPRAPTGVWVRTDDGRTHEDLPVEFAGAEDGLWVFVVRVPGNVVAGGCDVLPARTTLSFERGQEVVS